MNDDGTTRYRQRRRKSAKNSSSQADASSNDANDASNQPSTSGYVAPADAGATETSTNGVNKQDPATDRPQVERKFVPFTGEWSLMEVADAGRIVRYKTMPDRSVVALVKKLET